MHSSTHTELRHLTEVCGGYLYAPAALPRLKKYRYLLQWAGLVPGLIWAMWRRENLCTGTSVFYNDKAGRLRWAGPAKKNIKYIEFP